MVTLLIIVYILGFLCSFKLYAIFVSKRWIAAPGYCDSPFEDVFGWALVWPLILSILLPMAVVAILMYPFFRLARFVGKKYDAYIDSIVRK